MKKIVFVALDFIRGIRKQWCTFWLKRQLVSYGECIGAARVPRISRQARVEIGSYSSFNGLTISGLGGGKNWVLFS